MEICASCLLRIGDMVARPWLFSELERQLLIEAHGDAVVLIHAGGREYWGPRAGGPLD